jgi:O-acetyl-ADP-ribose deacetylase (regulator of RNase III)
MKYKEIEGDLISLALAGEFDVIAHGCNCQSVMGAGLAPQVAKAFGCDMFEMELWGKTIEKLGCIDYKTFVLGENTVWSLEDYKTNRDGPELTVINAYTQYDLGKNLDYEALTLCLRKINHIFKGKHIGLPLIGCGIAGGVWDRNKLSPLQQLKVFNFYGNDVKTIIQQELKDCQITIVKYKP